MNDRRFLGAYPRTEDGDKLGQDHGRLQGLDIDELLDNGGADMTLDAAPARWEYEDSPRSERDATIRANQQGLKEMDAGPTRPFEDFDREFRERHSLPPRA